MIVFVETSWDDDMKAHIHSRIDRYLADDIMTVVKSMQQHVSESHLHTVDLSVSAEAITDAGLAISEINDEINRIKRRSTKKHKKNSKGSKDLPRNSNQRSPIATISSMKSTKPTPPSSKPVIMSREH